MCSSAMRPVCGSTNRTTAFTDLTSNNRGKLPSRDAVLASTTTRSSLQASANVTREVYWWLNRFDLGSALTNFFVSLTRPVWKATSSALQFGVLLALRRSLETHWLISTQDATGHAVLQELHEADRIITLAEEEV